MRLAILNEGPLPILPGPRWILYLNGPNGNDPDQSPVLYWALQWSPSHRVARIGHRDFGFGGKPSNLGVALGAPLAKFMEGWRKTNHFDLRKVLTSDTLVLQTDQFAPATIYRFPSFTSKWAWRCTVNGGGTLPQKIAKVSNNKPKICELMRL